MRSTFHGIETAKRALATQQAALQTTGHNIANASTKGYSRQVVNMIASRPLEAVGMQRTTTPGQLGQGVEFDYIKRVREQFLDDQYYNENKGLGDWSIKRDTLDKLETIFNEPSDTGVSKVIQNFWKNWQVATNEPENITARANLKESALAMTDAFNQVGRQLNDLRSDLTSTINANIAQANTKIQTIAALNQQIFRIEALGNDANDLRDQRNLTLDELSGLVNVNVAEGNPGYTVKMGNVTLVDGVNVETQFDETTLGAELISGNLQGGELNGMYVSRDQLLDSYQYQIDEMVRTLAVGDVTVTLPAGTVIPEGMTVGGVTYSGPPPSLAGRTLGANTVVTLKGLNELHSIGYALGDPPAAPVSGTPFFSLKPGYSTFSADSITLNPTIVAQPNRIAVHARTYVDTVTGLEHVIKGNNDMGHLIIGLSRAKFDYIPSGGHTPVLSNGTVDEFFRSLVGQLGVQSNEAQRQADNAEGLVQNIDSRRMSISGVSLDEEMSNLIKFQQSYNAAARTMTTFDELLDKVINSMGLVGR